LTCSGSKKANVLVFSGFAGLCRTARSWVWSPHRDS